MTLVLITGLALTLAGILLRKFVRTAFECLGAISSILRTR